MENNVKDRLGTSDDLLSYSDDDRSWKRKQREQTFNKVQQLCNGKNTASNIRDKSSVRERLGRLHPQDNRIEQVKLR